MGGCRLSPAAGRLHGQRRGRAIPATLLPFFVADRLQVPGMQPLLLLCGAAALGLPLWVKAVSRWGLAPSWRAGMLASVLAFGFTPWLGTGDGLAFAVICLASGLALGADLALPGALLTGVIHESGQGGQGEAATWGGGPAPPSSTWPWPQGWPCPCCPLRATAAAAPIRPACRPWPGPMAGCPACSNWRRPGCSGAPSDCILPGGTHEPHHPLRFVFTTAARLPGGGIGAVSGGLRRSFRAGLRQGAADAGPAPVLQRAADGPRHVHGPLGQGGQAIHRAHDGPLEWRRGHAR